MIRKGKETATVESLSRGSSDDSEKCEGILQRVAVFYNAAATFLAGLRSRDFLNRLRDTSQRCTINRRNV